ncbi:hypothetical protein BRDID11004_22350 [Bradyrhizobium diazoefficiens]|uniref:Uncharacterized protein n=1 Tax=Bradyrhizobium diazoefficiens TaxID=1355477 RepID=A0A810AVB8_9BRAD|nr:hypothetical protein BDHF08_63880 [Bradyrhizobium diazoefficiens]BCE23909.1 hypothetical protein XF1B_65900 [Bradyrhizobium diazoefficiens]BCE58951.1 hypothetical protein XF5B_64630 [Bradyrhizobium diazoefficiens]BCE67631.1 hypothetical protein XF6B_64300 [Bradyrhizobium diazoefficiens]BCF28611.1 hypothetical protein XF14B_65630 [Bradyrhizobium diazoefficiens]
MVQPTRIVCCAREGLAPVIRAATAPVASINLETVRIAPTPLLRRRPAPPNPTGPNVSWFKQSGKPCKRSGFAAGRAMYGKAAVA